MITSVAGAAGLTLLALYWLIRVAVTRFRLKAGRWAARPDLYPGELPSAPSVSVCVPARNEAAVIGACVRSVLAQDYPRLEQLVVVDDGSDDGTGELARQAAEGDERLQVVLGEGPPPGWVGKSAAVWRAQQGATGDWLLFVDADVRLHPRALSVAMAAAREHGAHMVSWFGQLETKSFWEHVLMPYIGDILVLSAPLARVNDPGRDDCLANGQFILIARSAYDAVGGHEAIKDSVVDDVSLGRAVKFHEPVGSLGYALLFSDGLMTVRMYDSLGAIWKGFAKNFYAGAQRQGGLLVALVAYMLLTSVVPLVAGVVGVVQGNPVSAALGFFGFGSMLTFRAYAQRFQVAPLWAAVFQPLAALVTCGIVLDSWLRGVGLLRPVKWKGRAVR